MGLTLSGNKSSSSTDAPADESNASTTFDASNPSPLAGLAISLLLTRTWDQANAPNAPSVVGWQSRHQSYVVVSPYDVR